MRMMEFRKDPERVKAAQDWLAMPIGRELISIMLEEQPLNDPVNSAFDAMLGPHADSKHLGIIRGYNRFLDTLISASSFQPEPKEIQATYSKDNI